MFTNFIQSVMQAAAGLPFNTLLWTVWGSFIAIFVLCLALGAFIPNVRRAPKKPFLCLVYAYTALTLATYLTVSKLEEAAFAACIFYIAGYACYGLLCALFKNKTAEEYPAPVAMCATAPAVQPVLPVPPQPPVPSQNPNKRERTAAGTFMPKNNVRLEHAIAVTDKLLQKNLGKSDRQELEKLKNTLHVLKIKGSLTPAEGEILNENFNTLLKLMAKYNA